MSETTDNTNLLELTAELVVAWLSNPKNNLAADELPRVIESIYGALASTSAPASEEKAEQHLPAVTVRRSLASREHIVSLIDGKPYKTLKRHLANHGLTPDEYRVRYGLKPDYPMVAPAYAERRSALAKNAGLGRKADAPAPAAAEAAPKSANGKGRAAATAEPSSAPDVAVSPAPAASPAPAKRTRSRKAPAASAPAATSANAVKTEDSAPAPAPKRGRRKAAEAKPSDNAAS